MSPHRCRIAHGRIAMQANCLHLKLLKKSTAQLRLHHTFKSKSVTVPVCSVLLSERCDCRHGHWAVDVTDKRKGGLDLLKNKTPLFPIHSQHHSTDQTGRAENKKQMLLFPLLLAVRSLTNTAFSETRHPPKTFSHRICTNHTNDLFGFKTAIFAEKLHVCMPDYFILRLFKNSR